MVSRAEVMSTVETELPLEMVMERLWEVGEVTVWRDAVDMDGENAVRVSIVREDEEASVEESREDGGWWAR